MNNENSYNSIPSFRGILISDDRAYGNIIRDGYICDKKNKNMNVKLLTKNTFQCHKNTPDTKVITMDIITWKIFRRNVTLTLYLIPLLSMMRMHFCDIGFICFGKWRPVFTICWPNNRLMNTSSRYLIFGLTTKSHKSCKDCSLVLVYIYLYVVFLQLTKRTLYQIYIYVTIFINVCPRRAGQNFF